MAFIIIFRNYYFRIYYHQKLNELQYLKTLLRLKIMENLPTRIKKNSILGPWPRPFLFLASRGSVLEKSVLGLERCVLDSTSVY